MKTRYFSCIFLSVLLLLFVSPTDLFGQPGKKLQDDKRLDISKEYEDIGDADVVKKIHEHYEENPSVAKNNLYIFFDLTWQMKETSSLTTPPARTSGGYRFHAKASFMTRLYRPLYKEGNEFLDEIECVDKSFIMIPLSHSGHVKSQIGEILEEGSRATLHKIEDSFFHSQDPDPKDDLFDIILEVNKYTIVIDTNVPGADPGRQELVIGGNLAGQLVMAPYLEVKDISYNKLIKEKSITFPINEVERYDEGDYGGFYERTGTHIDGEVSLTGHVILSLNPPHCNPWLGLEEGKDFVFRDFSKMPDFDPRANAATRWVYKENRPVIFINEPKWKKLSPEARGAVVMHEREHRRHYIDGEAPIYPEKETMEEMAKDLKKRLAIRHENEYKAYLEEFKYIRNCIDSKKVPKDKDLWNVVEIMFDFKENRMREKSKVMELLKKSPIYH